MQRILTVCENNVQVVPPNVITLAAATPTEIFASGVGLRNPGELVSRYVQNLTGGDLYLSFGVSKANGDPQCNNTNLYHAKILDGQLFDCLSHRQRVCAYSAAGGAVATTMLIRN